MIVLRTPRTPRTSRTLRALRAFALFWIDFVVGDDWTVAATVGAALLATWGLHRAGIPAWWLTPVAVICATVISLRRARRATPSR